MGRKMKNAATNSMPVENRITEHHYGPAWGTLATIGVISLFFFFVFFWQVLLYLIRNLGYYNAERVASQWILALVFGAPALLGLSWILSGIIRNLVLAFMRERAAHQERMLELQIELLAKQSLLAGTPAPANERLTDEQKAFRENLLCVMDRAYRHIAKSEQYGKGDPRPWSREQVLNNPGPRYGKLTFGKARDVRQWLVDHRVIIGHPGSDQINTEDYPGWSDFIALVEAEYNMPVKVNPPQEDNSGYIFIDG